MNKLEERSLRIAGLFLSGLILFYRYTFAVVFGGQCRFTPSCSAYALEAIDIHGPVKGARLAIGRICRCHPWGKHGFNPVPPRVK